MSTPNQILVVPTENIKVTSKFWSRMQRSARETSIPASVKAQKELQHWYCLTWKDGHEIKPHAFWDSDIYKIIEAACCFLKKRQDAELSAVVEEAVGMIEQAQHSDGYINSYFTVRGIQNRWTNTRDLHELYCLGHLLEATVAYETLTHNGRLLRVAMAALKHVDSIFGLEDGKKAGYPGHQEIEIGLLRLYDLTGEALPLKLAKYFILQRGHRDEQDEIYWDQEARSRGSDPYDDLGSEHKGWYHGPRDYGYHQANCLLTDATEVKGHSVRAMYYYTAATDLVRILPPHDPLAGKLRTAMQRLWRDMVDKKIYVTGGLGSVTQWEGFGPAYSLSDLEVDGCYSETCAAFALINWCQRMLQLSLESEYADVMENALYNAFLGAVSVQGDAFYYQNVLRTIAGSPKDRSKWFGVACCPPNVAKLLGSIETLMYSWKAEDKLLAIHMYLENTIEIPGSGAVVTQKTDMPWSGKVTFKVQGTAALGLRIPSWAKDTYSCSVKGVVEQGYLYLQAITDSEVTLDLPMKPRKIFAHPQTGKDQVCVARGPLIYCFENADNPQVDIDHMLMVNDDLQDGTAVEVGHFDKVPTIIAKVRQLEVADTSSLYTSTPWKYENEARAVTAIPYFLRANRGGNGAMRVWTDWANSA